MAPEVQGAAYGLSADLWSAGCLFYAMVTGGAPFQGRRVGDTLANARAGRYVVPEGLSDAAKDFLACMLSKVRWLVPWYISRGRGGGEGGERSRKGG